MVNIKDLIYAELCKVIENVSDTYPANWSNLPAIQYMEEENNVYEYTDDGESKSYVRYVVHIWDNKSTSKTACDVDKVMSSFGLKRSSCSDINDPSGMKHKQMRFEAVYDVDLNQIFFKD